MWTTKPYEWHEPTFVHKIFFKCTATLTQKRVGIYVLVSSLQRHLLTFIPFHPTILTLELFQVFGCKCSFSPFFSWVLQNIVPNFQNTVSAVLLVTQSLQVWPRSHVQYFLLQKFFLDLSSLGWVLLPCAPIPRLTSCIPGMTC